MPLNSAVKLLCVLHTELWSLTWAHGPESADLLSFQRTALSYKRSGRRLADQAWAPLRIHLHTGELDGDISDPAKLRYLRNDLLPAATHWLSQTLRVKQVQGALQFDQECSSGFRFGSSSRCSQVSPAFQRCGETDIPRNHFRDLDVCPPFGSLGCRVSRGGDGIANADFAFYVRARRTSNCGNGVVAYAHACRQDTQDRPIAGYINFCKLSGKWSDDVSTALHEMLHAFGFSSQMFAFYRHDDGRPRTPRRPSGYPPLNSENRYVAAATTVAQSKDADGTIKHHIALPRVVAMAREYFGCPTLDKVPLEEDGGDGSRYSHWEERAMFTEVMAAQLSSRMVVSNITLALLEDSGWYKPVYARSGLFQFGRNKGCEFLNEKCVQDGATKFADTFCPIQTERSCGTGSLARTTGCTHDMLGKAICDNCVHARPLPAKFQNFASNPRLGGFAPFRAFCPMWVPYQTSTADSFCSSAPSSLSNAAAVGETFGATSRCVLSTAVSPRYRPLDKAEGTCRQVQCQEAGVQIRVADNWVFCGIADEGKQVVVANGWSGHVVCPSYALVCAGYRSETSAEHSRCVFPSTFQHGRCVCAPGYLNEDCAVAHTQINRIIYPHGLQYVSDELILEVGAPLSQIWKHKPSILGNTSGLRFSVKPPLPSGLSLSSLDGVLGGVPLAQQGRKAHTIRAASTRGASTTTLFITIVCPAGKLDCAMIPEGQVSSTRLSSTDASSSTMDYTSTTTFVRLPVAQMTSARPPLSTTSEDITSESTVVSKILEQPWFFILGGIAVFFILIACAFALACACFRRCAKPWLLNTNGDDHLRGGHTSQAQGHFQHTSPGASNVPPAVAAHAHQRQPRSTQDDAVAQMLEMGYDFEVCLAALEHSSWDVNRAVAALS